ncbi:MAG TPA: hypothetical protein DCX67_04755 [Opitutae bacterium]|nr:hypothetical protein [Opitutae bacterium]
MKPCRLRKTFNPRAMNPNRILFSVLALWAFFFLGACGGDEAPAEESAAPEEPKPEEQAAAEETLEPEPEPVVIPNPNGVYVPTGQLHNDKPVYANGEGFFMWTNGSIWKISDKVGGGRTVSTGEAGINDKWTKGTARFYPDKANEQDALFRLAVAYQGAQDDNPNAIRLFERFVQKFPDHAEVPAAYLSLGDLAISEVKQDEQPSFSQISKARQSYALVREKSQQIRLLTDATFNEGGLLERVAGNPEGLVDHMLGFDKNQDDVLQSAEFSAARAELNATSGTLSDYDINSDKSIDYEELFNFCEALCYSQMEALYRDYNEKYGDSEGARVSEATQYIGLACEKQGRPSEMLKIYYKDIEKFGNDPNNVGVDGILKKYADKYKQYDDLYGQTLELLEKVQTPSAAISFEYTNRKGVQETISGTVKEILEDRRKLLPWLSASFKGMDSKISTEVAQYRAAIFVNPDYSAKFKGYLRKYKGLRQNFPSDLSPAKAFASLFQQAQSSGQRALELRMRATLEKAGSSVGSGYTPQRSDFPVASPGVLVWMAGKLISQNATDDAIAAMERLVQVYGETGGEFLFDAHYMIGKAKQKQRDFGLSAAHYEQALANSSWHENSHDARIRRGESLFEVGKTSKDKDTLEAAFSSFKEVRKDSDEASLEQRAQSSFMMGECRKAQRDYGAACVFYMETYLNFPSAVTWAPKAFEQAIACYEQTGQADQISRVNKEFVAWQRKFLK